MFALTGCGSSQKVTCTTETTDASLGYTLKLEAIGTLEEGEVIKEDFTMVMTFESEELATTSYNAIKEGMSDEDIDVKQDENVITVTQSHDLSSGITRSEFISTYEEDGYSCE